MEAKPTAQRGPAPAGFRLDLSVTPGNAQEFELWRSGISPMFMVDALDRRARDSYWINLITYQFGDLAICAGTSSAGIYERTTRTIARSGLDHICIITYAAGGCQFDREGRAIEIHPGDVCILDLTRRSALRLPDCQDISVVMPRALLEPLIPDLDSLHGLILKRSTPLATMLVNHLWSLFREAPSLGIQDARAAVRGTTALIAAFVSARTSRRKDVVAHTAAVASLYASRQTIEANLANPDLGPEFLSRHVGVSRATLYRLFEPIGGVREYIQQRRLMRAYQMITDPANARERIGTISARCGFGSDAVFSRAFREAYGLSPTDMRRATGQAGAADDLDLSSESTFMTMNRWLIGMDAAGR